MRAQSVVDALTSVIRDTSRDSSRLHKIVIKDDPEFGIFGTFWQDRYRHDNLSLVAFYDAVALLPDLQVLELLGFPIPKRRDSFELPAYANASGVLA